jgi:hypothetical protein
LVLRAGSFDRFGDDRPDGIAGVALPTLAAVTMEYPVRRDFEAPRRLRR